MDFPNVPPSFMPPSFPLIPIPRPCPHVHQAVKLSQFVNTASGHFIDGHQQFRTYPLKDSLSPGVPVHMSPTGETICARCKVSYCCRDLFMLHLETSLDHNLCVLCHYTKDYPTFTELQDHLEQEHLWCEPCNWFAPSYEGLMQHFQHFHFMCSICKECFRNVNEYTGHANTHRPLTVACPVCPEKFALRSAAFNHIESGTCTGGATTEDICFVVRHFWANLTPDLKGYWVSDSLLFTCQPCHRHYQRLSDLLQHKETKSCPEGYGKGNSMTDRLVQYVQQQLPVLIEKRKAEGKLESTVQKPKLVAPAAVVHPRVHMLRRGRLF
ncbi:uncharacterized protein BHQ10_001040 [Talaromyces amestolkiae]|uniref:C2H2-type domain-containing protein n=1 Tax=Talaromyces amestolkiae TaxID=1196081 RepID=A0A364KNA2_TALAM|nr:uncharacterized protein BHQ10_001040 [Talaromyces amestolkiae]RAO65028.1 hypothetical protein BHQ10_001040 [Talaromyces amestolkiae]